MSGLPDTKLSSQLVRILPCHKNSFVKPTIYYRFTKSRWSSFSVNIPDRCCIACEREFTAISSQSFCAPIRYFCVTIFARQSTMQKLHIHICTQVRCHYPHQVFASFAIKGSAEYDSCHAQAKMWHWFDKTMRQAWRKARWTCMFVIHFVSHEPSQDSERCRFPWEPRCLLFRLAKIKWLKTDNKSLILMRWVVNSSCLIHQS